METIKLSGNKFPVAESLHVEHAKQAEQGEQAESCTSAENDI